MNNVPAYKEGHCPETLAWSHEMEECKLECIFPFYSDTQLKSLFIVDQTLACIGFTLCYIYCMTTLFRPVMQKFPNSNIFFLHFSLMIYSSSFLLPLFLSPRYVFCDNNTTLARHNWACVANSILFFYGISCATTWFAIFHVISTLRLFLIRLPAAVPYICFVIGFFSWHVVTLILGLSLDYIVYFPGIPGCAFEKNLDFAYGTIVTVTYILIVVTLACCLLISLRLFQVKKRTKVKLKVLILKQIRLFAYWAHFFAYIVLLTVLIASTSQSRSNNTSDIILEYEMCVKLEGNASGCSIDVNAPAFMIMMLFHICTGCFPLSSFLVFGARRDLILYWKEYFIYCWKNKRLVLSFAASFDPSITTKSSVQTLDEVERNMRIRNSVREL